MFSKILVPLDGSPFAESALDYAHDLVKKYGASLILVRACWGPVAVLGPGDMATMPPPPNTEESAARDYLSATARRLGDSCPCEQVTMIGDPSESVLRCAEAHGADLIVISSHGRSGFQRFLMGSVAERITRHSPCPVLIIGKDTLARGSDVVNNR